MTGPDIGSVSDRTRELDVSGPTCSIPNYGATRPCRERRQKRGHMTGNALDTLREQLGKPWCPNLGSCPSEMHSGCSYCADHDDAVAALARVAAVIEAARPVVHNAWPVEGEAHVPGELMLALGNALRAVDEGESR